MSEENNDIQNIFGSLLKNEGVQNLLKNEGVQNIFKNFVTQIGSQLISCDIFNKILDENPKISDELISNQINLFEKAHPKSSDIINKYLQSYQEEEDSNKKVYQIRKFVKSGDCKKALDDPQVKKYLNEVLNSPEFEEKFQQLIPNDLTKHLFSSQ